jgi:hypothetical protein
MKKIILFAPEYNPNIGGSVVIHKLCHLINELGGQALLFPFFGDRIINLANYEQVIQELNTEFYFFSLQQNYTLEKFIHKEPNKLSLKEKLSACKNILFEKRKPQFIPPWFNPTTHKILTNPLFNTPTLSIDFAKEIANNNDYIVVYPEVVSGNPLRAKNIVRWFLHDPGFHTNHISYGSGELYFRFGSVTKPFKVPEGSTMSDTPLTVLHFPLELYNSKDWAQERSGTAYCIRKGKGKPIVHDLTDSILIDDLPHEEIAKIFKRVKQFISYDTKTAYSYFAAVCGCESIVIPDPDMTEDEWIPYPESRVGIAFGFEDLPRAKSTASFVEAFLLKEQSCSSKLVENFLLRTKEVFAS